MRLAQAFYGRVAKEPALKRLFPGKSVRCATEEFAAFLVQFLGGDEARTQKRWWLSLRESHARFTIGAQERAAWLEQMAATLEESVGDETVRAELWLFFEESSLYAIGSESSGVPAPELRSRWRSQLELDACILAIAEGRDEDAVARSSQFQSRPSVFVGLLMRMLRRESLTGAIVEAIEKDLSLMGRRFGGRSLLHAAAGAGRLAIVESLLRLGADPNVLDAGGHTPLYSVANEASGMEASEIVKALLAAGGQVNACGGVTRATPLHMAARRGNVPVARALLEAGADPGLVDAKGDTPLQRAFNCRKRDVAELLRGR